MKSKDKYSDYIITAADPGVIDYESGLDGVDFRSVTYHVAVPNGRTFKPADLQTMPGYERLAGPTYVQDGPLAVLTTGHLDVNLGGPTPIAGYTAMPNSTSTLQDSESNLGSALRLHESFRAMVPFPNHFYKNDGYSKSVLAQGASFVDFLGPDLTFWTPDQNALVSGELHGDSVRDKAGTHIVTVVEVSDPSFSIRVGMVPYSANATGIFHHDHDDDTIPLGDVSDRTSGTIQMTATHLLSPQSYSRMYRMIQNKPLVQRPYDLGYGKHAMNSRLEYRYPPIPNNSGFNIFGSLDDLSITDAVGAVKIGNRQISIPAPESLDLSNISEFRLLHGASAVSVPLQTSTKNATAEFQGVSGVHIGDTDESENVDNLPGWASIALWVLTVVGFGLTALGTVKSFT